MAKNDPNNEDYIIASISGNDNVYDGMRRLKCFYPNAIKIVRESSIHFERKSVDHTKIDIENLFKQFHKEITDESPTDNMVELFGKGLKMSNEEMI